MKKLLAIVCFLLGGCAPFPWCQAMDVLELATQGTDIIIVKSCNPHNAFSSCVIMSDERIAVQFRRPSEGDLFCVEYLTMLEKQGIYDWSKIKAKFEPENAIFLFLQDIEACLVPDPGQCIVD